MVHDASMQPPQVIRSGIDPCMWPEQRAWQGIPSMEIAKDGTMFAVFYSGGKGEERGNYVILARKEKNNSRWEDPYAVIVHRNEDVRCYDSNLWIDPLGRLWLTWSQSMRFFDGRMGVWAAICEKPSEKEIVFTKPFRIGDGVMMGKPTVLRDGTWLFPCALWRAGFSGEKPTEVHEELKAHRLANVYASIDNGQSFQLRGGVDMPNRSVDEHMIVERNDGSLWMLVRRRDGIGEAFSFDEGYTWVNPRYTGIKGPDSRFFIRRLKSGNLLLVNHYDFCGRNNLMAKLSLDDGKTWTGGLMIDSRKDISYPDGCQDEDGLINIVYDHDRYGEREILLARFREEDILQGKPISEDTVLMQVISKATGCKPEVQP